MELRFPRRFVVGTRMDFFVKLLLYVNFQPWMQSAHQLLDFLVSREDATPFRHPVDLNDFPVS